MNINGTIVEKEWKNNGTLMDLNCVFKKKNGDKLNERRKRIERHMEETMWGFDYEEK